MSQRVIARRFALALSDSVPQEDPLRAVEGELTQFAAAVSEVPELHEYLAGPLIPLAQKREAANKVLDLAGASQRTKDFVQVVLQRHRAGLIGVIAEEFSAVVRERLGIVDAEITSATPLDDEMKARSQKALAKLARKEVRASFQVDPSLVGGLRARIGSTIYDGSIRGRLDRLREQIAKQ